MKPAISTRSGIWPNWTLSARSRSEYSGKSKRNSRPTTQNYLADTLKFSKALAKGLDPTDEIQPAATEEQIGNQERTLDFTLPSQVREFFLLTAGINVFTGVIVELSGIFNLTIHGERYCVLGEFWKEADGDQLLLRPGEDTIWYYAHEQDKVKAALQ